MIICAAGIVLGTTALIAVIRAIKRTIYFGTAPPPATGITYESTNISGGRGGDDSHRVCVTPAATHDRRELPRIATFR